MNDDDAEGRYMAIISELAGLVAELHGVCDQLEQDRRGPGFNVPEAMYDALTEARRRVDRSLCAHGGRGDLASNLARMYHEPHPNPVGLADANRDLQTHRHAVRKTNMSGRVESKRFSRDEPPHEVV